MFSIVLSYRIKSRPMTESNVYYFRKITYTQIYVSGKDCTKIVSLEVCQMIRVLSWPYNTKCKDVSNSLS